MTTPSPWANPSGGASVFLPASRYQPTRRFTYVAGASERGSSDYPTGCRGYGRCSVADRAGQAATTGTTSRQRWLATVMAAVVAGVLSSCGPHDARRERSGPGSRHAASGLEGLRRGDAGADLGRR